MVCKRYIHRGGICDDDWRFMFWEQTFNALTKSMIQSILYILFSRYRNTTLTLSNTAHVSRLVAAQPSSDLDPVSRVVKPFQRRHHLGPAVVHPRMVLIRPPFRARPGHPGPVQSIVDLLVGPVGDSREHLALPAEVLLEQHRMGTPDHSHAGPSPGLDAGNAVLEHEAFLGIDDGLPLGSQLFVDALQCQEVDVRRGLASPLRYPGVVAEDAARGWEGAEEVRQVGRLEAVVDGVRGGGERELGA